MIHFEIDELVLNMAIEKYGQDKQLMLLLEETTELMNALVIYIRFKDSNPLPPSFLYAEIADLLIMINQFLLIFPNYTIQDYITFKINRLKSKLI